MWLRSRGTDDARWWRILHVMSLRNSFKEDRRRVASLRLAAQRLAAATCPTPADAVRWMLALQAQDFAGVKWSLGLRAAGPTEALVEAAFDAGEIVRSWPMRGTLHVVAAEDLGWMLELTAPRAIRSAAARRAVLGITEADVERAREIAVGALAGRRVMSRTGLLAAFDAGGVSTSGQRGYHLLWYLAQTGTLVMASSDGRGQAFARLDEWIARPRRLGADEGLAELALRYFRSHGPATARDLARWSGLTVGDVRRGIAACGGQLATLEIGGVANHLAPEALDAPDPPAAVLLLPGFDEYLLGYGDRSAALAPEHADVIVPGGNGMFRSTIVVDGEVVGTWSRSVTAAGVVVEASPFAPLGPRVVDGLEAAARAYGRFLGKPARLAPAAV
jgi:hypothetical protein